MYNGNYIWKKKEKKSPDHIVNSCEQREFVFFEILFANYPGTVEGCVSLMG